MNLATWKSPFFQVKWLVCTTLVSDCEFGLTLHLIEHHAVRQKNKSSTTQNPVDKLIAEGDPIVETANSRKWRLTFTRAVASKSESESYSFKSHWPHPPEKGRSFIVEQSPWIKELGPLLEDLEPN